MINRCVVIVDHIIGDGEVKLVGGYILPVVAGAFSRRGERKLKWR